MRGLAVLIMIECHVFNSFTRVDQRSRDGYVLSQFVGGMAAPLFIFMAGMTLAFLMDRMERQEAPLLRRWESALRRAGYLFVIAYLFRFTNWAGDLPNWNLQELLKVDILNCMGLAMAALSLAALFDSTARVRFTLAAGLAIAAAAPLVAGMEWGNTPGLVQDYLRPGHSRFPFFPYASYLAFGIAAGTIVKRAAAEHLDRVMQWAVLIGFGLVFGSEYFAGLPYSLYDQTDFWRNSPALILIRLGVILLLGAGAYLWTEFRSVQRWSWMDTMGKTSLMVYWVHVMLVYGITARPVKRALTIPESALAVALVTLLMVGLSAAWLRWKTERARERNARAAVAGQSPETVKAF